MKVISFSRQFWSAPTSHSGSFQLLLPVPGAVFGGQAQHGAHLTSTQPMRMTRWPYHVRDRDAGKITI
jgi:hypothetical protein